MNLLNLLPQGLKVKLLLSIISQGFRQLSSQHVGQQLNALMDKQFGVDVSNPTQKELAGWLRQVANELET